MDCSIVENLKMESNTPQQKNNSVIPPVFISAAADVSFFIGYVLIFHALGMLIKFVLTSDPWDPWSGLWNMFLDVVGEDKYYLWVYGTVIVTSIHYWLSSIPYTIMDLYGTPAFLMKYKIQPEKNVPLSGQNCWL